MNENHTVHHDSTTPPRTQHYQANWQAGEHSLSAHRHDDTDSTLQAILAGMQDLFERLTFIEELLSTSVDDEPARPHLYAVCSDCSGPDPCENCALVQEAAQATVDTMHLEDFLAKMHEPVTDEDVACFMEQVNGRVPDYEIALLGDASKSAATVEILRFTPEAKARIWTAIQREL